MAGRVLSRRPSVELISSWGVKDKESGKHKPVIEFNMLAQPKRHQKPLTRLTRIFGHFYEPICMESICATSLLLLEAFAPPNLQAATQAAEG